MSNFPINDEIISPKILELINNFKIDKEKALSDFWKQIESEGTPIFEQLEEKDDYTIITFIIKGDIDAENYNCFSMFVNDDVKEGLLTKLEDTNVFFKSYEIPKGIRENYFLTKNNPLNPKDPVENLFKHRNLIFLDPNNPKISKWKVNGFEFPCNVIETPDASPQPYFGWNDDIDHGNVKEFTSFSKSLNYERKILIYTPSNYSEKHSPYHFLLLFDGLLFEEITKVSSTLDNLIANDKIPQLIAVLVENFLAKDIAIRAKELPPNPKFLSYIINELLPWIRNNYNITSNPSECIIAGASYGGLASSYIAFKHSEIFGNVISMSGGYFWYPGAEIWQKRIEGDENVKQWWTKEEEVEEEWLTRQFSKCERLPLKFYVDVGVLEENDPYNGQTFYPNRNFRTMLQEKGYPHHYVEYLGGHDFICWRGSIADGLIFLIGK